MKKLLIMLLAAATMVSVTACGSKEETKTDAQNNNETVVEEPVEEKTEDKAEETPAEENKETETAEVEEVAEESIVNGEITAVADDSVTIKTEDGKELTFPISEETDKTEASDLAVGDKLEVSYSGDIEAEGSTVVVNKLVKSAADAQ